MKKRYKVVKVDGPLLTSSHAQGQLKVPYSVGTWTCAPIGGLFVFKDWNHAKNFATGGCDKIYLADVTEAVPLPGRRLLDVQWLLRASSAWRTPKAKFMRVWPAGSEAYRLVRLIKGVPR